MSGEEPYGRWPQPESDHEAPVEPTAPAPSTLAVTALILGLAAICGSWAIFIGALFGIAGIVVGIHALRTPGGRGYIATGIILSGLAALINLVITVALVVIIIATGALN